MLLFVVVRNCQRSLQKKSVLHTMSPAKKVRCHVCVCVCVVCVCVCMCV